MSYAWDVGSWASGSWDSGAWGTAGIDVTVSVTGVGATGYAGTPTQAFDMIFGIQGLNVLGLVGSVAIRGDAGDTWHTYDHMAISTVWGDTTPPSNSWQEY
jgi:hypothetical protein